ncbi:MAG TPA: hypothetical protein VK778_02105 [Solirubrobacteraceae bacterium]|jgi:hypothetical protein|nr:hypothetical protein [Solirubrobacteraceae bacterium]
MSFRAKFLHAVQQMKTLEAGMDAWIATEPYTVDIHVEAQTGERVGVAMLREQPNPQWALDIGDCLYGFRSSLDHLAFELAEHHTAAPLPSNIAKDTEFPIYGPMAPDQNLLTKKIGAIDPAAKAIIEALQPHHRGNPAFERDPLWILSQLCNLDKHRTLHVVVPAKKGIKLNLISGLIGNVQYASGPVNHGAEVIRFSLTPDDQGNMEVQLHLPYFVSFSEDSPAFGEPVIATLNAITGRIAQDVFGPLAVFLR